MGTFSLMACDVGLANPFDKLGLFFSLSKTTENTLPSSSVAVLNGLLESLEADLVYAVQCTSEEEFARRRTRALPRFCKLIHAASLIARAEIDEETFPTIICDSLDHLRAEFASRGIANFGSEASERVAFCIFTMKRIMRSLPKLIDASLPDNLRERDKGLSAEFCGCMLVSHFHLACLRLILKRHLDVPPVVIVDILNGIGVVEFAYAKLREGLELREIPQLSLDDVEPVWDDEDQVLLDESERTGSSIT